MASPDEKNDAPEGGGFSFEDLSKELGGVPEPAPEVRRKQAQDARRDAPDPTGRFEDTPMSRPGAAREEVREGLISDDPGGIDYQPLEPGADREEKTPDPNEFRVLTGSAPTGTPPWVSSAGIAGFALVIAIAMLVSPGLRTSASWLSYIVFLLCGGSLLYSGSGWFNETFAAQRNHNLIGVGLSAVAAALGFLALRM